MNLIKFKYHPNLYEDEILVHKDGICQCCGRQVSEYIGSDIYAVEDLECICLSCISDGSAAKKFNATFVQDAEPVSDPALRDELFCRTPGYLAWQGEYWLACCDDYCEYLGMVGIEELDVLGIKDEVLQEYATHGDGYSIEDIKECLSKDGDMTGYVFRCLHCGKYRLYVDAS